MANKSLFASLKSFLPRANARNEAGGVAYRMPAKHALAQLAATGCFNGIYYADAEQQLATLLGLIAEVDDARFLAKLAVYSRERAGMKDMVKRVMDGDKLIPVDVLYPPAMIGTAMALTAAQFYDQVPVRGTFIVGAPLITKDNAKEYYFPDSPF